jgi:hypothetical protein
LAKIKLKIVRESYSKLVPAAGGKKRIENQHLWPGKKGGNVSAWNRKYE